MCTLVPVLPSRVDVEAAAGAEGCRKTGVEGLKARCDVSIPQTNARRNPNTAPALSICCILDYHESYENLGLCPVFSLNHGNSARRLQKTPMNMQLGHSIRMIFTVWG